MSYFSRSEALLGKEDAKKLSEARGIVFGVGGVGSWCVEALVRTGLGHIKIVDPDVVTETNVNRQLPAAADTIGQFKVRVMKDRLAAVVPDADVEISANRYTSTEPEFSREELQKFDFIIDAIDSVDDKVNLILCATSAGIPIYSSMGAALRLDPTKVRTGSFKSVNGDKLAKALRNRFRKTGNGIIPNFKCVFTDEPPMKSETLGSLMQVTATFGMCLAYLAVEGVRSPSMVNEYFHNRILAQ